MTCSTVKVAGQTVILCGRDRVDACVVCHEVAGRLCDWKVGGSKTCDAPICDAHTTGVGKNKDLCPKHAKAWEDHPANRQAELPL